MPKYHSLTACVGFILFLFFQLNASLADEQDDRIAAGKKFLNASRVDQWEKYFSEGLPKLGKIVLKSHGRKVRESWFENNYLLITTHESDTKSSIILSNPNYLAMVRSLKGENTIASVDASASKSKYVYVEAIPFAISSSINFTRELIPRYLQEEKLTISDYRYEDHKHFVELKFVDGSDRGMIELIFRDDNPSMLPDEAIQNKGSPHSRHFVNKDFIEVFGYHLPMKVDEKNTEDSAVMEVSPNERLDTAMCKLSYYGLPEPGDFAVSDFGRTNTSWRTIVIWAIAVLGVCSFAFVMLKRKHSEIK